MRKVSDQSVSVQKIRTRVFQIFTLFLAAGLSDKVGRDGEVAGKGIMSGKQNLFNIAIFDIGIGERICVSLTDVTTSGILDRKLYDVRVGEVVVERRLRVEKLIQYWYRSLRTTGCPTIEYSLCFYYFDGFYSSLLQKLGQF